MKKKTWAAATVAATTTLLAGSAGAAGFALIEQGVKGLGQSYAGAVVAAEDPTTVFFNPAGMTYLKGTQLTGGLFVIAPSMEMTDSGSTISPALGGAPLTGDSGGNGATTAVTASLYATMPLNDRITLGIGIGAPFGLATEYSSTWKGRYQALDSEIMSLSINPSIAVRVNDDVSIGVGVSAMYFKAKLTQAVDFSVVCLSSLPPATCAALGLATPQSPATDGTSSNEADDWGFGMNLGVMWKVAPTVRAGLSWRSQVIQKLEGDGKFTYPAALPAALQAVFANSAVTSNVRLPWSTSAGISWDASDQLSVMMDATYTGWSSIKELRIDYANPAKADGVETLQWDNAWRYGLGAAWKASDAWRFRAGAAFDQSPIPNAAMRTARLPDADRTWVSAGLTWTGGALAVDAGYAHLFFDDAPISRTGVLGDTLRGAYDNSGDILGVQLTWAMN